MRRWIGRWIVGVGLIHILFGIVVFRSTWSTLLGEGLINTVNGQPEREFAVWFTVTGILTLLVGALIDWMEARGTPLPVFVGWSLLILTAAILVLMPISGGWLLLPGAIGAIFRSHAPSG